MNKQTEEALRMAIGALLYGTNHTEAVKACKAALQENALDRMAENARELGLEYCKHGSDSACKECYMEQTK